MSVHPATSALVQAFIECMAVPVLWLAGWRLFKALSR